MAFKKPDSPKSTPVVAKATPVAEKIVAEGAVATVTEIDYEADAGGGFENMTKDSFAIPFISIIQKGSPQLSKQEGKYNPDAEEGMIYESVTGRLFSGDTGVEIILCDVKRVFVRWEARTAGGGFRGEVPVEVVAKMRESGEAKDDGPRLYVTDARGDINPKTSDRLVDTNNHYVLLIDPEDESNAMKAMISLSSTQIKKGKALATALSNIKHRSKTDPTRTFLPPTWSRIIRLTTLPEANELGSWYGNKFELTSKLTPPNLYLEAREFRDALRSGRHSAQYDETASPNVDTGSEGNGETRF